MTFLHTAKSAAKQNFPALYERAVKRDRHRLSAQVETIVASRTPPRLYDERHFDQLQRASPRIWHEYAPNIYTRWNDNHARVAHVLRLPGLHLREHLRVLEVSCGSGMAGPAFASFGHTVLLHDKGDWRDTRAKAIGFVSGDLCQPLGIPEESFDLVCSWDSFEHIPDVEAALVQLIALCAKGGHIYLDFGPLWCSPLGLHALNFHMAYGQFLFAPDLIEKKMREWPNVGGAVLAEDGAWTDDAAHMGLMNQYRPARFRRLWKESGCEIVWSKEVVAMSFLKTIVEHARAFSGLDLTLDDVTTERIAVLLKKPG